MFSSVRSLSVLSLLVVSLLSSCAASTGVPRATSEPSSGKDTSYSALPDFELTTLKGERVALSDHLGKRVILLDFWATYCAPCLVAMPHLNGLYKKYEADGFIILGVSVDGPESQGRVRSTVRKMNIDFPILLDEETEALALYNPNSSAPYSVLISREGKIIKKEEGFEVSRLAQLEKEIRAALKLDASEETPQ